MIHRILVVGAGLSGAVIARELAERGYEIDVIEKRNHIGGNCYDYIDSSGIRVHKYGPHIFHTNNKKVVNWLSRFTDWIDYKHKVKAILDDGTLVTIPPNKQTLLTIGRGNIVDVIFRPYTRKMWNKEIEELDASILKRIPLREDDNELYFPNDSFQALPSDGYTALIEKILNHKNISLTLDKNFEMSMEANYHHVFNSMPIDEYYDFKYGHLPYRSIIFHTQKIPVPKLMTVPTTNFTHDGPYTRVTEWKLFPKHGSNKYETVLTFEEPVDYKMNNFERYYPVKDIDGNNRSTYKKYHNIPNSKVTFIGRCGMYVYIDMDQAVSTALSISKKFSQNGKF